MWSTFEEEKLAARMRWLVWIGCLAIGCSSPSASRAIPAPQPGAGKVAEAAQHRGPDGYLNADGLRALARACDAGDMPACTAAGRELKDHPSTELRNGIHANSLLRAACARGDAVACHTIAVQWHGPFSRWHRHADEIGHGYAERACKLGSAIGCAIAVAPNPDRLGLTRSKAQAAVLPILEKACRSGDAAACARGGKLGRDLSESVPFTKREAALELAACDAGRGEACAKVADWLSNGYPEEMRGLTRPPLKAPLHYAIRACRLGHQRSCLDLVGVGWLSASTSSDLQREHQDAAADPELVTLNSKMEAACNSGRVAACAWLAEAASDDAKVRATYETRARSALANICGPKHDANCDGIVDELVDLRNPHLIGMTLTVPTDEACASGSVIACVIVIATSFSDQSEQRIDTAFRNVAELGLRLCKRDHVRCAGYAHIVLTSTRHMSYLLERGNELARKMFAAACAPDTSIACLQAASLGPSDVVRSNVFDLYRRFEERTCLALREACGGTQCDAACLAGDLTGGVGEDRTYAP